MTLLQQPAEVTAKPVGPDCLARNTDARRNVRGARIANATGREL